MKLFIVDDDQLFRNRLVQSMIDRGHETFSFDDPLFSLSQCVNIQPDVAVVDLRMPGMSGLELVSKLRELSATLRIIILTGYGSISTAMEAIKRGADEYLTKPINPDQLHAAIVGEHKDQKLINSVPTLAQIEWDHIQRILQITDGNITRAAGLLKIPRRTLQRKLSKDPGRLV
jgi:two-component system response regulator RegA